MGRGIGFRVGERFEVRPIFLRNGFAVRKSQESPPCHVGDGNVVAESFTRPSTVGEEVSELSNGLHGWVLGG